MRHVALLLVMALAGCASTGGDKPTAPGGTVLLFSEKLPEQNQPDNTRMLITPAFLRIDNGPQAQDFILFDRQKKIIYNLVANDLTVMVIEAGAVPAAPNHATLGVEQEQSQILPRNLAGTRATHYKFNVDNTTCYNVVAVPDLLPDAVQAMREYRQTLAAELAASYGDAAAPDALCDALVRVYEAEKSLSYGFPVREWGNGYQRFLMDYQVGVTLPDDLFAVPADYRRYSTR